MEAGLEQERLQQEAELNQKVNEEEVPIYLSFQNTHNSMETRRNVVCLTAAIHFRFSFKKDSIFLFPKYESSRQHVRCVLSINLTFPSYFHTVFQVRVQLEKVKTEVEMQSQQTARLKSSCRVLDSSLGQSSKRLQVISDCTV